MFRKYGDTDFITGLRAYAALAVVMVHTEAFSGFGSFGRSLSVSGMHGVVMFFVIAGFSVATSYEQIGAYGPYLVRRLIRIWPVYMITILIVFFASRTGRGLSAFDAYNLAMHATFLSFLDYRIANNIIGVEWTIPVEVFWYLVIPIVIVKARNWLHLIWAAVATILVSLALSRIASFANYKHLYPAGWMPFTHGPYFLAGVLAYQVRKIPTLWPAIDRDLAARFAPLASVLGLIVVAASPVSTGFKRVMFGLATFALIAFHRRGCGQVAWLLENRLALLLGTISYSLYLVHLPILGLLQAMAPTLTGLPLFASVAAVASVVSLAAFYLIERPTNNFGRQLTTPNAPPAMSRPVS
jgi:exopolysaccharide production protein ExoZ